VVSAAFAETHQRPHAAVIVSRYDRMSTPLP
jgi:hypothetical protein